LVYSCTARTAGFAATWLDRLASTTVLDESIEMPLRKCERCGQRPPKPRAAWCAECLDERMRIDLESWAPLTEAQRHRLQALFRAGQVPAPPPDEGARPPAGDT
jgi:hypothetical protein